MNIENYELKIGQDKDFKYSLELAYHGNECIVIRNSNDQVIRIPRDILEKFIEMIR